MDVSTVAHFVGFSATVFVSEQTLGECFSATLLNGSVLHGISLHSSLVRGDFLAQTFHKVV